ncbi:MAG: phenylalanine--tRNA ligase subunit alpha [Coriobacteriales bacterium]|jgi:phenylalanyl-tRNA synthetase alpha chain|nr:phenylalanine--tRNA ligase subunit alpha [Coriobacteriales bacterium]
MSQIERIAVVFAAARSGIAAAANSAELEQVRVAVFGKKGSLSTLLRQMGALPKEQRAEIGRSMNTARDELEAAFEARAAALKHAELEASLATGAVDVTLPGRSFTLGSQHLISRLTAEIVEVFRGIGYSVVEGTEIDTAYYNFTALNTPADHPSRSLQDTFFVHDRFGEAGANAAVEKTVALKGESDVVLRTQTSGVQVHVMERQRPPIYILAPGRVYRRDVADPTHLPQFTQIEGLVVDKGITFGDLKGTLEYFCEQVFGADRKTRFRPHFFPFTEPSAEVDVSCGICGGAGCRSCGGTGWLEILGCGMVDPNVYGFVGIDPEVYSGFAFGLGVERIACLKYNVPDLRLLLEGDMRFLRQF